MSMKKSAVIKLTKDNYNDYDLFDIVAISIASGGAMGDPGAIEIVTSKGEVFYANPLYENISMVQVYCACPILTEIELGIFSCIKKPIGWSSFYLGYGNHLLLHDSINKQFQFGQKQRQDEIQNRLLYNVWLDIVLDCIDGKIYKNEIVDRIKGTLFGQAIGDALGLGTEFMDNAEIAQKYPNGIRDYIDIYQDSHRRRWLVGEWTDDTDMMLCIANAIIDDKEVNLTHIARNFKEWAEGEPMGIGLNTYKVLKIGDYVDKPFDVAKLTWTMSRKESAANGGVMRTSIVGLLPNDIEKYAADICRLTHYDPRCVGSCVIVSELIHSLVYDSQPLSFEQIIEIGKKYDDRIEEYIRMAKDGTVDSLELQDEKTMGYTLKTLAIALWAYWHCSSFEEGLLTVVNAGGDADTNAAVACAILGAKYGYSSIPREYVEGLIHLEQLNKVIDQLISWLKGSF